MERYIPKHIFAYAVVGFARAVIWRWFGDWKWFSFLNEPGALLVVYAEDTKSVLCVHPSSELWATLYHRWPVICHLPGGGRKPGETPEAALLRELREELEVTPNLAGAQHSTTTVECRRLRNPATFFLIRVSREDAFSFKTPAKSYEFYRKHQWRPIEDAFKHGTRWMQAGLRQFGLRTASV